MTYRLDNNIDLYMALVGSSFVKTAAIHRGNSTNVLEEELDDKRDKHIMF